MKDRINARSKSTPAMPVAMLEANQNSERCRILAKKGFLKLTNLTSGLAILIYSQEFQLGVLFHLRPGSSHESPELLSEEQSFTRSAMAMILSEFQSLGVRKRDLVTYAVGGSATEHSPAVTALSIRQTLWSHGLTLTSSDLGGKQKRSVWMDVETGRTVIRSEALESNAGALAEPIPVAS